MGLSKEMQRLQDVLSYNRLGAEVEHVVVALPSFGLSESTLAHYAPRIPALEHRFLNGMLLLGRIPSARMIYLCSEHPGDAVLEYYFSLMPDRARERFELVVLNDSSPRPLANKMLEQPHSLARVRELISGRPAMVEPWNVTDAEIAVARELDIPCNGTPPALWPLGFKSAGRQLFRRTGVPLPYGTENITTPDEVRAGLDGIRHGSPNALGAVIKHDNSGSGDGNAVVRFDPAINGSVEAQLERLPAWYLADLKQGGIVEELIFGEEFASPSAQVDLSPDGSVQILATHEQELGGPDNQVYQGCRFPANPDYAGKLADYVSRIAGDLARSGVIGRISVDFVAGRSGKGEWDVRALEINLRKGGTTHPYSALRNLVPGQYDFRSGRWIAAAGGSRYYRSTDNLVSPSWIGLAPQTVIDALERTGLAFDRHKGTGVVLHMLSCLAIDGRFGLTAIGGSPEEADRLVEGVIAALP